MHLKKSILFCLMGLLFSFLAQTELQAQCCGAGVANNELGFRLGSYENTGAFGKGIGANKNEVGFLSGLHFKRYSNFSAFRMSVQYDRYDIEQNSLCEDCGLTATGKVRGGQLRVGYEWIGVVGALEPYVALDLVGAITKYDGVEERTFGNNSTKEAEITHDRTAFGLSPVIGVRFFFTYMLSISLESRLDGMLYWNKIKRFQELPEAEFSQERVEGAEIMWHPLGNFSLNVLF